MTPSDKIMPRIDLAQCDGCGLCVKRCPTGALAMEDLRPRMARPDLCSYCATCEDVCPQDAIALPYQIVLANTQRREYD
jgi:formate hydrogenlyase subunit 6/NADH:ubiquinone oxidoreductase subunit I